MPSDRAYVLGMSPAILTADELLQIPDKHAELVRGVLIVREPPGLRHGRIALELGRRLADHVDAGRRLVRIYRANGVDEIVSLEQALNGEDVVPGFACQLATIL